MACTGITDPVGLTDWRNFLNAVEKAKESCKTSAEKISDHFVDVNKMIDLGKGGQWEIDDILEERIQLNELLQAREKLATTETEISCGKYGFLKLNTFITA